MRLICECYLGRCKHAQGCVLCSSLQRLWTQPDDPKFLLTEIDIIGQILCVPNEAPFPGIVRLEELCNEVVSFDDFYHTASRELFEKLVAKIVTVYGGTVSRWDPFTIKTRVAYGISTNVTSGAYVQALATIVLGIASRDSVYAYEFIAFLLNGQFGSGGRALQIPNPFAGVIEQDTDADVDANQKTFLASSIRDALAEGCDWAAKVMLFVPSISKMRVKSSLGSNVYRRGEPTRTACSNMQLCKHAPADERTVLVKLSHTSYCVCGLPWCDAFCLAPIENVISGNPLRCCVVNCFTINGGCTHIVISL